MAARRFAIPDIDEHFETIDHTAIGDLFARVRRGRLEQKENKRSSEVDDLNGSLLNLSLEPDLQQELQEVQIDAHRTARRTNCSCTGKCIRKCPCVKDFIKCNSACKCMKKKCTNKLEEVAVQEADFGTMESGDDEDQFAVLSDLEPLSSSCDESDGNESEAAHTLCNCKGSCQRGCPCKSAKNFCTDDCRCAISKCKQRGSMHNIIQRRHPTPAAQRDMASEQEKRCQDAYINAKQTCSAMEKDEIVEFLATMAKFSPSLWTQVNFVVNRENQGGQRLESLNDQTPEWCVCGCCKDMDNERENVCCKNAFKSHNHPLFENHILTEHNLELAMRNNGDHLNFPFDPSNNACWRYTAYRQYIMWVWGHLGRGNRKVIPACIVLKIRNRFPDERGNYTGFMDVEYNL